MQARRLETHLERLTNRGLAMLCRDLGLATKGTRPILRERLMALGADPVMATDVAEAVLDALAEGTAKRKRRRAAPPAAAKCLLTQFDMCATAAADPPPQEPQREQPAGPPNTPMDGASSTHSPPMITRAVPPFSPPRYTPQF